MGPAIIRPARRRRRAASRSALLVDSFEQCRRLETWLRDRFLPRLGDDAVVVVAGRRPPELEWAVDPGWQRALRVLPLRPLDRARSELLLHANGVDPGRYEAIVRFAGGNPLALSLAAATTAATAAPGRAAAWVPSGARRWRRGHRSTTRTVSTTSIPPA